MTTWRKSSADTAERICNCKKCGILNSMAFLATWIHAGSYPASSQTAPPSPLQLSSSQDTVPQAWSTATQLQDLTLGLINPQTTDLSQSSLSSSFCRAFLCSSRSILSSNLVWSVNLLRMHVILSSKSSIETLNWPQYWALGSTTADQLPTGFNSIQHHSLGLTILPVFHPVKTAPIQATNTQFPQENAVGDSIQCFTEVWINKIHSLSLIHQPSYFMTERDQVSQTGSAFRKPICEYHLGLILWLSCTQHVMALRMICSMTFPSIEDRLTGLYFHGSPFWPFWCMGITFANFPPTWPSPVKQDCW